MSRGLGRNWSEAGGHARAVVAAERELGLDDCDASERCRRERQDFSETNDVAHEKLGEESGQAVVTVGKGRRLLQRGITREAGSEGGGTT